MLTPLSREAAFQMQAAEGWVELKSPSEALLELEAIPERERSHPEVLAMFWRVYVEWQKWQPAYDVACQLVAEHPGAPDGWIDRAYALRRMRGGGLSAAFDALMPALKLFPLEPVIPYNLACYCAQMEKLTEARDWLEQSMVIGDRKRLRRMALADPDLDPLKALGYLK
jgi:hypothetical protein